MIIDATGIILTNGHVVEDADEVLVELADGREFKATNIKTDQARDLAVLRGGRRTACCDAGRLPQMDIGDWVFAIGNPFELEQTVGAGIISGRNEFGTNRDQFPPDRRGHQSRQQRWPVVNSRRDHRHQHGHHQQRRL